jgi:Bifunctional DNA primase/polymerase, N-terminal
MSVPDNGGAVNNPVLDAALAYAAAGIPVFPCEPSTKQPIGTLVPPDRDPRGRGYLKSSGGFKKATTDPALIKEWWTFRPDAMLGLPTGAVSGVFVVDLDVPKKVKCGPLGELTPDGLASWQKLRFSCETYELLTGGGGLHIYFKYDPKRPITNKEGAIGGSMSAVTAVMSSRRRRATVAGGITALLAVMSLPGCRGAGGTLQAARREQARKQEAPGAKCHSRRV